MVVHPCFKVTGFRPDLAITFSYRSIGFFSLPRTRSSRNWGLSTLPLNNNNNKGIIFSVMFRESRNFHAFALFDSFVMCGERKSKSFSLCWITISWRETWQTRKNSLTLRRSIIMIWVKLTSSLEFVSSNTIIHFVTYAMPVTFGQGIGDF